MKRIVLFDGDCSFCNKSVQFIIKRDPKGIFHFASLQGELGQKLLSEYNVSKEIDSIVLIDRERFYCKSSAALRICKSLRGFWKLFFLFIVIPPVLRNLVYDYIAENRYKWFGQNKCALPTKEFKERLLD